MTIFKLQLKNLVNSDHVTFMEFTVKATEKFPYITEIFPVPVSFLKDAYDKENNAYLKRNRSYITKRVQAANETRILRFREVNNMLKGTVLCTEPGKAEAAEFLLDVVKDYGGASSILSSRVDSISGILTNLVEDFQEKFPDKVATVGLTECVEELRVANEAYKTLRSERTEEVSEIEKAALRDARAASDTAWRGLIDSVNLRYYYQQDEQLVPFMRYMNTEIDWYRTILNQKPGNADTNFEGGEEEEEEQPTAPTKYTISFVHNGQTVSSMELEAGAPVTAPAAPSGYHWVDVPATMPGQNVTVQSAQDSNEPPSLTR